MNKNVGKNVQNSKKEGKVKMVNKSEDNEDENMEQQ